MAKTIKKYKYNEYNKNQQTNKQVILHKIFYIKGAIECIIDTIF